MAHIKKPKLQKTKAAQLTTDSFQNFTASLGIGTNNQSSGSTYGFNPITRTRVQLEWMYRGSWIAAAAVDIPAEDMCRAGITIHGIDPDEADQIYQAISDMNIWANLMLALKWGRLYGGSLAYFMIDGQDPATELKINTIGKGQFKGLMAFNRWQTLPSVNDPITELGIDYGLPKYYNLQDDNSQSATYHNLHHSRVGRFIGIELPWYQKVAENGWGESILERIYDRLIAFDSVTQGAAQLAYKAHLRVLKIDGFRDIIAAGGQALAGLTAQIAQMRALQSNEGITVLDMSDEFSALQYSFGGLNELIDTFGDQISGALQIPKTRLFGTQVGGLATGGNEGDLAAYYDNLQKQQEMRLRHIWTRLLEILSMSVLGKPLPEGTTFTFNPLWQMSETDRAEIVSKDTDTVIKAYQSGLIDSKTAKQELRNFGHIMKLFNQMPDDEVQE